MKNENSSFIEYRLAKYLLDFVFFVVTFQAVCVLLSLAGLVVPFVLRFIVNVFFIVGWVFFFFIWFLGRHADEFDLKD